LLTLNESRESGRGSFFETRRDYELWDKATSWWFHRKDGGEINSLVSLSSLFPVYYLGSLFTEENQKPEAQEPLIEPIHVDLQSREQGTYCTWKTFGTHSLHDPSQPAHCPPGLSTLYFTFFLTLSATTTLSFFYILESTLFLLS